MGNKGGVIWYMENPVNCCAPLLSVCLLLSGAAFCEAKSITVKYSDHDPPGGMRTDFLKNVWLPEIEKQTGGQVKVQDFWGGALLGSKEIFKGIGGRDHRHGVFSTRGTTRDSWSPSRFSNSSRGGPAKFENMAWFYRKVYEEIPEFNQELKKANQMTLLFTAGLPGAFTGKNPLPNLNALKGDKWRAGDKWALRFLQNAGAVPVSVPWGRCLYGPADRDHRRVFHQLRRVAPDEVRRGGAQSSGFPEALVRHAVYPQRQPRFLERTAPGRARRYSESQCPGRGGVRQDLRRILRQDHGRPESGRFSR